jgi:hypothetical protein
MHRYNRAESNANAWHTFQARDVGLPKFGECFEMSGRVSYHHMVNKSFLHTTILGDHKNRRLLDFGLRNQEAVDNIDCTRGATFQVKMRNETAREWVCVVQSELKGDNFGRMICPTKNIGLVAENIVNTINLSYSLLPPSSSSIRRQKDTTVIPISVTLYAAPLFTTEEESINFVVKKQLMFTVCTDYAPQQLKRWVLRERLEFSKTPPYENKCDKVISALKSMAILCEK